MNIEIDQSGKIENTSKNTIIAFSNDIFASIFIKAKDKREIQKIFRKIGKPRIFSYKLFSILIFLLIKKYLKEIGQIIIDEEYPGKSMLIKDYLLREIKKIQPNFSKKNTSFKTIGKKSKVHSIAYNTFKKKRKADIIVEDKDILKFILSK